MGSLHRPATSLPTRLLAFRLRFFLALLDMRLIMARLRRLESTVALVSGIGAKILRFLGIRFRPFHLDPVQSGLQHLHVMHVGPAGDERQRDATAVD